MSPLTADVEMVIRIPVNQTDSCVGRKGQAPEADDSESCLPESKDEENLSR